MEKVKGKESKVNSDGKLGRWIIGVMDYWINGVMEFWNGGTLYFSRLTFHVLFCNQPKVYFRGSSCS